MLSYDGSDNEKPENTRNERLSNDDVIESVNTTVVKPPIVEKLTTSKTYPCKHEGCDKVYGAKQHLSRHVRLIHKKLPFERLSCFMCGDTFSSKQNLDKHTMRKHTNEHQFKCSFCVAGFKTKTLLAAHLFKHTETPLLSCDLCPKKFATHYRRHKHQKSHKLYKCVCKQEFTIHKSFLEHKRLHKCLGSEYHCDECGQIFKERINIIRHLRKHLEPEEKRVFDCPHCSRSYAFKYSLMHHIDTRHGSLTYDCNFSGCNAKLTAMHSLRSHYERHINPPEIKQKENKPRKRRKDAGTKKKSYAELLGGVLPNSAKSEIESTVSNS